MEEKMLETVTTQPELTAEEIQKRIQEAVDRARADWSRAQAEQTRMAAMTQEERAGYEMRQRESALDEREREITRRELRAMAVERLAQRGLPRELADALPYDSEAACLAGLDKLERVFRNAVQAAVDQRLRGETPAAGKTHPMDADNLSDAEYYRLNAQI